MCVATQLPLGIAQLYESVDKGHGGEQGVSGTDPSVAHRRGEIDQRLGLVNPTPWRGQGI
jgi:hypothetical protein